MPSIDTAAPSIGDALRNSPLAGHPLLQRARGVARRAGFDRVTFAREHLDGSGLPVLIADAMDAWPARQRWSFEFFRTRYGSDEVVANLPMFLEPDLGFEPIQARMTLADYLDYIRDPSQPPRAEYLRGDAEALRRNRLPLYAPVYRVLSLHPELAADVNGSSLPFIDDLLPVLPLSLRQFLDRCGSPIHYAFFSPTGSVSFLHADYWATHAYLAQIAGRKLCVLFAPEDAENVYHGAIRNPLAVDPARFPRFADAQPHVCVLEAGDTAFIPSGWWHFVIGLEPCLTYSYNFVTRHNLGRYLAHLVGVFAESLADPASVPREIAAGLARLHDETRAELAGTTLR